jgi:hypothetical protein
VIHNSQRDGAKRHQVVRILTSCGKFADAAVIGRQVLDNKIGMDFELRNSLGLNVGKKYSLEIRKLRFWGALRWYLRRRDPAIRIPALLASLSIGLGVVSLLIALFS